MALNSLTDEMLSTMPSALDERKVKVPQTKVNADSVDFSDILDESPSIQTEPDFSDILDTPSSGQVFAPAKSVQTELGEDDLRTKAEKWLNNEGGLKGYVTPKTVDTFIKSNPTFGKDASKVFEAPKSVLPMLQTETQGLFVPETSAVEATGQKLPATKDSEDLRRWTEQSRQQQGLADQPGLFTPTETTQRAEALAGIPKAFEKPQQWLTDISEAKVNSKHLEKTLLEGPYSKLVDRLAPDGVGKEILKGISKTLDLPVTGIMGTVAGVKQNAGEAQKAFADNDVVAGTLYNAAALTNGAFGVLMNTTGGGLMFQAGQRVVEQLMPESKPLIERGMSPFSSIIAEREQAGEKVPSAEKAASSLLDAAWNLFIFKKAHETAGPMAKKLWGKVDEMYEKMQKPEVVKPEYGGKTGGPTLTEEQTTAALNQPVESEQNALGQLPEYQRLREQSAVSEKIAQEKAEYESGKRLKQTPKSEFRPAENVPQEPTDVQQVREELLTAGVPGEDIVRMREPELRSKWREVAGVEQPKPPAEVVPPVTEPKSTEVQSGLQEGKKEAEAVKPQEEEKIVSAAARIGDKTFTGTTHGETLQKAIEAGEVVEKDGRFYDKAGNDLWGNGWNDLFLTSKGELINRFEASKRFGISAAEDLQGKKGVAQPVVPVQPTQTQEAPPGFIQQTAFRVGKEIFPSGQIHNAAVIPERVWGHGFEDGFLTNSGRFVNREEAARVSNLSTKGMTHDQITRPVVLGASMGQEIPEFKDSPEAIAFGRKGMTEEQITAFNARRVEVIGRTLEAAKNKEWEKAAQLSAQSGFLREAIEASQGTINVPGEKKPAAPVVPAEQTPPVAEKPQPQKQPWEMTRDEYLTAIRDNTILPTSEFGHGNHERIVFAALKQGKPVPPEVLKDYPDLAGKAKSVPENNAATIREMLSQGETVEQIREQNIPQEQIDAVMKTMPAPVTNRADYKKALVEKAGYTPEQAEVHSKLQDARAETSAAQTGRPKEEWYATNFGEVRKGTEAEVPAEALLQAKDESGKPLFRAVAIEYQGKVYEGKPGQLHPDLFDVLPIGGSHLEAIHANLIKDGFVTKDGRFLTRGEAANMAGQSESHSMRRANLLYQEENAPTFFSSLSKTVDGLTQEKWSPQQLLAKIRSTPGIKQEELTWTGLETFLNEKKGPVTKSEVQDYLRANNVEVKEVVKSELGEDWQAAKRAARFAHDMYFENLGRQLGVTESGIYMSGQPLRWMYRDARTGAIKNVPKEYHEELDRATEAIQKYNDAMEVGQENGGVINGTKFGSYVLPGAKEGTYRELRLTLPGRTEPMAYPEPITKLPEGFSPIHDANERPGFQWGTIPPGQVHARFFRDYKYATKQEAIDGTIKLLNEERNEKAADEWRRRSEGRQFTSAHFDEPNILAHVRFNERADSQGKKVLFIEEVQSDWHEKGRKEGYAKPLTELPKGWTIEKRTDAYRGTGNLYYSANEQGRPISSGDTPEGATRNTLAYLSREGVPPAPFEKTWPELAMKRMIRWAAENGYDKVAWTTGEQQAARYDLSKQIKEIEYEQRPAEESGGQKQYRLGITAINNADVPDRGWMTLPEIEGFVGKEIAQKIEKGEGKKYRGHDGLTLEGLDLKVGGEGMKGFYDQILPSIANKLGKRFGGRVEDMSFKTGDAEKVDIKMLNRAADMARNAGDIESQNFLRDQAHNLEMGERYSYGIFNPNMPASRFLDAVRGEDIQSAHSMPITPDMRRSAIDVGFPLFQGKKGAIEFTSEGKAIIHALEADMSTMPHESFHLWRRDLYRTLTEAKEEFKPQIQADIKALEEWVGAKDGNWNRAQDEKFARAGEVYLRTGKAPTPKLQAVFDKFKEWLTAIYKSIKGSPLDVNITPEVRSVLDRMLGGEGKVGKVGRVPGEEVHRLSNMPSDLRESVKAAAKDLLIEAEGVEVVRGGIGRTENDRGQSGPGHGEVVSRWGTISNAPDWFQEIGRSKEDVVKNLQSIVDGNPSNKLAFNLIDKIVEFKTQGRTDSKWGEQPPDPDFTAKYEAYKKGEQPTEPLELTAPEGREKKPPLKQEEMFTSEEKGQAKMPAPKPISDIPSEEQFKGTMFEKPEEKGPEIPFPEATKLKSASSGMGSPKSRGAVLQSTIVPGAAEFIQQDVVPHMVNASKGLIQSADAIRRTFNPVSVGEESRATGSVVRIRAAELARKKEMAYKALEGARKLFGRLPDATNLDFIDKVETGTTIPDPAQNGAARLMRSMLENRWKRIQAIKGTDAYIENYFPHIWEDPKAAIKELAKVYSKRPLEGTKGYLKERTIPTIKEGVALGLKPTSFNPVDLVLARVHDMDKFIMAHDVMNDLKDRGLSQYVSVFDKAPDGWKKIDDRIATVFGNPEIPIKEYVDKLKYEKLQAIVDAYGLEHQRKTRIGGRRLGYAAQPNEIKTKFATPLGVLTHELGHHLDWKYDLWNKTIEPAPRVEHTFTRGKRAGETVTQAEKQDPAIVRARKEIQTELRALADLRDEGQTNSESRRSYLHKAEEKIANMIDAYVNVPEKFKEVAPKTYAKFDAFIDQHPELLPLKDVKSSLTLMEIGRTVNAGGMIIRGNYYFPEQAAGILNNYLSPGLANHPVLGVPFRALRTTGNFMNQVQLGLSAFHLAFTSNDAAVSKAALGIQQLFAGHPLHALRLAAEVPISPIENYVRGNRLIRDYFKENPDKAEMVNAVVRAGGRVKMDSFYHNSSVEGFWKALRGGNVIGAALRTPGAVVEMAAKPIMEVVVPRQKLGVFADMAKHILAEETKGKLTEEQTTARLQEAWDSVDNRMGQLVYDNLFWNRALKDLGLASVRSLGWNLGTIRELGGGLLDVPRQGFRLATGQEARMTPRMAYTIALPFVVGLQGAILGYLYTGKGPEELKDYFFPKTGKRNPDGTEERVSLATYMKDVYAYAEKPLTTIGHKLHPLISTIAQMLENADYYGVEIRNSDDPIVKQVMDEFAFIGKQFQPFSFRNLQQRKEAGGSVAQQVQSFFGITPAPRYIDQTPAEKMMREMMAKRGRSIVSKEKGEVRQFKSELVNKINSGKLTQADISKAMQVGAIEPDGSFSKDVELRLATTSSERMFKMLTADEAMKVYGVMAPKEKARYVNLLRTKMSNAARKGTAMSAVQ